MQKHHFVLKSCRGPEYSDMPGDQCHAFYVCGDMSGTHGSQLMHGTCRNRAGMEPSLCTSSERERGKERIYIGTEEFYTETEKIHIGTGKFYIGTERVYKGTEKTYIRTERVCLGTGSIHMWKLSQNELLTWGHEDHDPRNDNADCTHVHTPPERPCTFFWPHLSAAHH